MKNYILLLIYLLGAISGFAQECFYTDKTII